MIRIRLNGSAMCVPETSANKYALNVRLMNAETVTRERRPPHFEVLSLTAVKP